MAEFVGLMLFIGVFVAWGLIQAIQSIMNRRNVLKPQRLTMTDVGLSPEQTIRFCALARSKGISQQTLWREAALMMLDGVKK
jgi:hypothetical protein